MAVPLVKEIEDRILRACKTIRALPDPESRYLICGWGNDWRLPVVRSTEEAYGYDETRHPKFRPSPADVSDCLTALAWARVIPRREFKLVWWRSFGLSFRHIGLRIGRSDETARQRYRDAVLTIWYAATSQNDRLQSFGKLGNFRGKSCYRGDLRRPPVPDRAGNYALD